MSKNVKIDPERARKNKGGAFIGGDAFIGEFTVYSFHYCPETPQIDPMTCEKY